MDKEYYIYMHKNKINGKIYIGQTCQSPARRWRKGEGYKGCTYFYSAIQKYGWDNFEHIILQEGLSKEEADYQEFFLINQYHSNDNRYGYNLKDIHIHNEYSQQSKNKMSQSASMRFKNLEERKKQSERIKKAYQQNASRWDSIKKTIQCIETGETFASITEAAKWSGIKSLSSFGNFFAGRSKSCGRHPITGERLHWIKIKGDD